MPSPPPSLMPQPRARYGERPSPRSRAAAALLALAILALVALMLLQLESMAGQRGRPGANLAAITLTPDHSENKAAPRHEADRHHAAARIQPPQPQPPQPQPSHAALNLIPLSRAELAAADIAHMARHESAGGGSSGDSQAAYGPGEGPGGARLYRAEWYREPRDAELRGYMPASGAPPGSWAEIACKTIDHFHVENCTELGESPPGSGLSRALRQAAWQFLVRPPRINGQAQVGTWVRIRFDFTRGPAQAE